MQLYKPLLLCIIFFSFVFRDLLPTFLQCRRLQLLLSYCEHFVLLLSPTGGFSGLGQERLRVGGGEIELFMHTIKYLKIVIVCGGMGERHLTEKKNI